MTDLATFDPLPAERAGVALWNDVVGQHEALFVLRSSVESPVHAYLFVGPRGSGKRALARAFAAALLSSTYEGEEAARQATLVLEGKHADVTEFEREGVSISVEQADLMIRTASRSSIEGGRKVLILDEFHLATAAVPKLLKTIEEPPPKTFFIVLADDITPELVTVASRCVRIDLTVIDDISVSERLIAEGVTPERAAEAASAAAGDIGRARLLATDERLALRRAAWRAVPDQLDGSGAKAIDTADNLLAMINDAMTPLTQSHAAEVAELAERIKASGERGSGRKQLEDRHKREARRYRTDELRAGFTELARRYRDELPQSAQPTGKIEAINAINALAGNLVRNPNERLQLVALFLTLGRIGR